MTIRMIGIVLLCAGITFFLRAVPFLAFSVDRKMPASLEQLGKVLPSALMAILILYCMRDVPTGGLHNAISKLVAVFVVGVSYKSKHHTFLSIVLGTAVYMILLRIF